MTKEKSPEEMTQVEFEAWRQKQSPLTWKEYCEQWIAGELSPIEHRRLNLIHANLSLQNQLIEQLALEALPQILKVYDEVKAVAKWIINFKKQTRIDRAVRAIEYLEDNRHEFPLLTWCMFEEEKLYDLRPDHRPNDFCVAVLEKVLKKDSG